jgi:hypothetical protein
VIRGELGVVCEGLVVLCRMWCRLPRTLDIIPCHASFLLSTPSLKLKFLYQLFGQNALAFVLSSGVLDSHGVGMFMGPSQCDWVGGDD